MIKYIKMKKMERDLKYTLFTSISTIMEERDDIISLVHRLYIALKDIPAEDLKDEFVHQLAEMIHEENQNKEVPNIHG